MDHHGGAERGSDLNPGEGARLALVRTALVPSVAPLLSAGLEAGGGKSPSSEVPYLGCRRPRVVGGEGRAKVAEVNWCQEER